MKIFIKTIVLIEIFLFLSSIQFAQQNSRSTIRGDYLKVDPPSDTRTTLLKVYYKNGFLVMEYLAQEWQNASWTNLNKHNFVYDSTGNMIEKIIRNWQSSSWVNSIRYSFSYDSNNNTEQLGQAWQNGSWVNAFRTIKTYDPSLPSWDTQVDQVWLI